METDKQRVEDHFLELRRRFLHGIVAFVLLSIVGFAFSADVLAWLQQDLTFDLHALTPYEAFYTRVMLALLLGGIFSLPFLVYEFLQFAKPGLKPKEYRMIRDYLPLSFLLFVLGAAFGYEVVVKTALRFFQSVTAASDITAVWGLRTTIGFALKLSALAGVLFQLPVAAIILGRAGLISDELMREYRVHVIVIVLVLAAVATPPDIVSQLLVTIPILGLYEGSIFLVAWTT